MQQNETDQLLYGPACTGFRHVRIPIPDSQSSTNIKEGHAASSF